MNQKIIPHLWFDKEAKEASESYVSMFGKNSKVENITTLHNTPSGSVDVVSFNLWGFPFQAISAGPYFKINPSISFMVNFDPSQHDDAKEQIDLIWSKLSEGGKILMPLQEYPFSKKYGWVEDKYGVSWQLILTDPEGEERPLIIPSLLFVKEKSSKAEEARRFYLSIFKNSKEGTVAHFEESTEFNQKKGDVMFSDFKLENIWFAAMDGGDPHEFNFNEAISFIVKCEDQKEIDYYWEKLSAVPEAEQCGWLKDKFGVSWQIVPKAMDEMMKNGTPEQIERVTHAFLPMKKFDLKKLEEAYKG